MPAAEMAETVLGAHHPEAHMIGVRQAPAAKRSADAQIFIRAFEHFGSEGQPCQDTAKVGAKAYRASPGKTRGGASRGQEKARFYRVFSGNPCTETNGIIQSHSGSARSVEFLEKRRAARAVTVAAIKHLGHAPLLAEALVEALHTGRPPTPSKRLPPKSHTLWWAPEPWLTRAVPRDYRGRNPFRRCSRPDRRVGSGQPLAWGDGPRM